MTAECTIALEGATYAGSVAILRGAKVVAERTLAERTLAEDGAGTPRAQRGERLMPALAECIEEAALERGDIAQVVCGAGPGSFTSLRVAGSLAKGLASGYGVKLYSVPSLLLTVSSAIPRLEPGPYISVIDAMRDEWFALRVLVEADGSVKPMGRPGIVRADDLERIRASETTLRCIGPGQEIDARPHARGVSPLLDAILKQGPVDLASWEPEYGRLAEAQVRWEAAHGKPLSQ